ncbi:nicotinate-nucleotide--dimethylbenzimidazole phosphoribosyltransferase, partial [Streptomyces sp. NPDC058865]|uniref:nicotinate-nucleotide--dimethylbenzimidazole phosphoribosyltransferase n=1 Tax=Streptomyces sp. NPDC058865 TaxID=3346655 RepID=UPI0036983F6E
SEAPAPQAPVVEAGAAVAAEAVVADVDVPVDVPVEDAAAEPPAAVEQTGLEQTAPEHDLAEAATPAAPAVAEPPAPGPTHAEPTAVSEPAAEPVAVPEQPAEPVAVSEQPAEPTVAPEQPAHEHAAHDVTAPDVPAPAFAAPDVAIPDVTAPDVATPDVTAADPALIVAEEPAPAEEAPVAESPVPEAAPSETVLPRQHPEHPEPAEAPADPAAFPDAPPADLAEPALPAQAAAHAPEPAPQPAEAAAAEQAPPQPYVADPAGPQLQPSYVAAAPDQPLGQFVAVDGQVPTTPHLAPTPPQPIVLPAAEGLPVPAPREGDPGLVQHAEDLDTRAADQEEVTAEPRQSAGPAAPGYDDAEREAVLKVMRERRDIRNGFRSDPIPHEVLLRVLEAAHTAPSVGHSQPWDFVVIRSAETRRTMHELAMRQRDAYAKSLPKGRAKQFKELKIEAILDTPVNIVVTADPTRGGRHTLGRHTQPQMAPYSSALAVENLWLAARAEGLGVGWVSFFDEREMVRTLGLPEHLEVVAYLCVGYVDEFPDEPELMQAGWSKRRPLSWVVHEETYGRRALPGEDPHDLLAETVAQIRPLDAKALGEAWERQKRMTKPAGALGMLEIISAQLSGLSRQCPPPIPEPAAVAIFAGDHGVHAQGVTPWPQEVTAQMVANFLGGGAVCNAFAGQVGAEVCVVDVGVAADLPATPGLLPRKIRAGTSDMTTGPAMTLDEAKQAIEVGIETARDLVAAGNKALLTGEMGIANTTASAALISVFTGADPAEVTGRGTGINDETLARKTEVVRRALEVHQPDPADPIGVLAAIGGFEHAAMVGLLLGGASLRTPVILDGVSAGAAALVARAIAPEVLAACIAGHRSAEPGHVAALNKLGLRPLVDLDLRLGEGTGALLALPLVQSTARAMHEVATFDSAGVTEK